MLGSRILYLKGMGILMFQLSGFYCKPRKIKYGELRAGVDCWMGGRTVKAWLHMCLGSWLRV